MNKKGNKTKIIKIELAQGELPPLYPPTGPCPDDPETPPSGIDIILSKRRVRGYVAKYITKSGTRIKSAKSAKKISGHKKGVQCFTFKKKK